MTTQEYVYRMSEPNLYMVGYYDPNKKWHTESEWETTAEAAKRTAYLNGAQHKTEVILTPETTTLIEELAAMDKVLNTVEIILQRITSHTVLNKKGIIAVNTVLLSLIYQTKRDRNNIQNGNIPF